MFLTNIFNFLFFAQHIITLNLLLLWRSTLLFNKIECHIMWAKPPLPKSNRPRKKLFFKFHFSFALTQLQLQYIVKMTVDSLMGLLIIKYLCLCYMVDSVEPIMLNKEFFMKKWISHEGGKNKLITT
jgi:hypothetical protein